MVSPSSLDAPLAAPAQGTVAYIAGSFPTRSETFVYREVRALRERAIPVACVTLHESADVPAAADDLLEGLLTVYDSSLLRRLAIELIENPRASAKTVAWAIGDAWQPGESLSFRSRAALVVQAAAGVALARKLRSRNVSHLHAHFAHAPTTVAMYTARQLGISFSFTGHANDIFERRSLLRKKLRRASFVSCISEWHRRFYEGEAPEARGRCEVVRCGVDTTHWLPRQRESARSSGDALEIVTVCRLVAKKGVDTLLQAIARCTHPMRVRIAGDGPELEALERLAAELGLSDRVQFLGAVENDVARELVRDADAFVLPCRTDARGDKDGIPVALMEAMACGLLVVSGDLPAIRELIVDGENGRLVPPDDPEALAKVLDELATLRESSMGQQARSWVQQEFSLDQTVNRLLRRWGIGESELEDSTPTLAREVTA